jgi:hypothetical protein
MVSVMDGLATSASRRRLALVVALAALVCAFGAVDADAAKKKVKHPHPAANPPYYTLKSARGHCRVNYTRQAITISVRKHHRKVTIHQVRCVYTAATNGGKSALFPTDLPTAAITVNVIPSAGAASFSIPDGEILSVGGTGVLAGQSGPGLSAALVSGTTHGALALNRNGTFKYTAEQPFSGVDSFSYRTVSSAGESSTPATVTIHVTPVAVAVGEYEVPQTGTLSVAAPGLLTGDLGSGLKATLVSAPRGGALTLNADGSFSYVANSNYTGTDSFSFAAVDGAGQQSPAVTVLVHVGSLAPSLADVNFTGAVGNTELQAGGTRGGGAEVFDGGLTALSGDVDPNGGTLTTTPETTTTAQGGTVTLAGDGTFTYQPPTGFSGPSDSFSYQVNTSEGTSAQATATISFTGSRVWYVNNAGAPGGDGSSISPFNSLSAVNASAGDTIFLYGSATPYPPVTLAAGLTLVGQAAALVVNSETLLAASASQAPLIIDAPGAAATLNDGDSLSGITIQSPAGAGIVIIGGSATVGPGTVINDAGADGINATAAASLTVTDATIDSSAATAIDASGAATLTVTGTEIESSGGDAILDTDVASSGSKYFTINGNQLVGQSGTAVALTYAGGASGYVDQNTIGTLGNGGSGSANGDGIDLTSNAGSTALVAEVAHNVIVQIAQGVGIDAQTLGAGAMRLVLTGNTVNMLQSGSGNGVTIASGNGGNGNVCVNPSANTVTAAGTGTNGIEVDQLGGASVFGLEGFGGGNTVAVAAFLDNNDTSLVGGSGGAGALAVQSGAAGFTTINCPGPDPFNT